MVRQQLQRASTVLLMLKRSSHSGARTVFTGPKIFLHYPFSDFPRQSSKKRKRLFLGGSESPGSIQDKTTRRRPKNVQR
jgi:hypothetical protein